MYAYVYRHRSKQKSFFLLLLLLFGSLSVSMDPGSINEAHGPYTMDLVHYENVRANERSHGNSTDPPLASRDVDPTALVSMSTRRKSFFLLGHIHLFSIIAF